ncbi:DSD1 family PLP-dependent enzyme [Oceanibaculum indicum]|uniref:D-serine deaminase-like pyridoxal phosphate-dependent protein n=1 Tax=Oceanibaculum indicum TaxID=526216 RepID=A0A420WGF7_9PROT|nr:DSD1 family PLP-dependent enzyme [Oceanibaculum indicum]RKQ70046.1 D-serine deaminase-like pyridoxal phosphate-dependent protein [Oceanibaculum indicum]
MPQPAPAALGDPLHEVDTPALILDLDAFEANLQLLATAAQAAGVRLRPHAKTHKCAEIAKRQMALGAIGICCQKVSEAEAMVNAGIDNVLVSNEVVGKAKLDRLAALRKRAWVGVCADDAGNVDDLDAAAARAGVRLPVLVEIDVGAGRCGTAPGAPAVALARHIASKENLEFAGLQAYQGKAQHIREIGERRAAIDKAVAMVRETLDGLKAAGLDCLIVGGAGTGTFEMEAASGVYNELQAGSYVFMDADYARNLKEGGQFVDTFRHALFIYTTVMSHPAAERAYLDAGLKAFSVDSGLPMVHKLEGAELVRASDEHGALALSNPGNRPKLGDKLRLIPGHCDPTVNLYDWIVGIRDGRVEALWEVTARGALA